MAAKTLKTPIAVMIGGGSKLPKLIKAAKSPSSKFRISLVVSHKKESEGVNLALKNNIPAVFFNLVDWRRRTGLSRSKYMQHFGWFISQKVYAPKLLVFAGWDLVMDKNFFDFFKCDFGEGFAAINLHPALMPHKGEGRLIKLPDGSKTPIVRGEQKQVLEEVLKRKLTYFGPSVHFMVAKKFDVGRVIRRVFIKVSAGDTLKTLRQKLMPSEDKILVEAIDEVISKYICTSEV